MNSKSGKILLYIHGFGSSGKGGKAEILRNILRDQIIAPSLPPIPELAVDTLEQMVSCIRNSGHEAVLTGSSLGGYYATYLADKYNLKAVLINPAIKPYNTLAARLGLNHSYYDFSNYEFTQKHIDKLRDYDVAEPKVENFMLLLRTGDTVLDYREAVEKFSGATIDIEKGGTHSYEDIEQKIDQIVHFLGIDS